MHTTKIGDLLFHHDAGFVGDVMICDAVSGKHVATIPFEALKRLVAHYVRYRRIRLLEDSSPDEVLL